MISKCSIRFNALIGTLESTLTEEEMSRVHDVMMKTRGSKYRQIEKLVFMPSEDIAAIANRHLERADLETKMSWLSRWALMTAAKSRAGKESDIASYLLFDGSYAKDLIELGIKDAHAKAAEIHAFFKGE